MRRLRWVEVWYAPFALVNGAAQGLTPILLPLAVEAHGAGRVGLVMAAYNLGAFAAPLAGSIADRWRVQSESFACKNLIPCGRSRA